MPAQPSGARATKSDRATVMVSLVDGAQRPFSEGMILRVRNNREVNFTLTDKSGPNVLLTVPFHDGPGDDYTVIVSADGYRDAGYFFKADVNVESQISLLMIRGDHKFEFPSWSELKISHPRISNFLQVGNGPAAEALYAKSQLEKPASLACLLNLTQAMSEIDLGGSSPLAFFKEILWDTTMAQDRFFGYADPAIISAVRAAAAKDQFDEEVNCAQFHPGATCSWKQNSFQVANVQLTFHEGDTKLIDGVNCVKIEPDIDLYKNLAAHGLAEVIPNKLTHGLTDPSIVFAMRWTNAKDGGGPGFDPGYDVV